MAEKFLEEAPRTANEKTTPKLQKCSFTGLKPAFETGRPPLSAAGFPFGRCL